MKFVHLSDVNAVCRGESGASWESEINEEKIRALLSAIDIAKSEEADFVIISGGLFSGQPVTGELQKMNDILGSFPNVRFIIAAGDNDCLKKYSPVRSFKWADNVYYAASEDCESFVFEDQNTEISVLSSAEKSKADISIISSLSEMPIKLAVCCEKDIEKAKDIFRVSPFNYIALGGRDKREEVIKGKCYYSGGILSKGMDDGGAHGIYLVDLKEDGYMNVEFRDIPFASYISFKVEINETTDSDELFTIIDKEIQKRGEKNMYSIKLTGRKSPELKTDLSALNKKYRMIEIIDETEPMYDFQKLFSEHPQDMIGFYISSIKRRKTEMSSLEKKAMYYGIEALLKTSERE